MIFYDNGNNPIADCTPKKQISAEYRYIERLSKKPKNGDFSNFAFNEINNLQTLKSQI
jgi:hypothetical protein